MTWVFVTALFLVMLCVVRWVFDNHEDYSGPLFLVTVLLTIILLGFVMYMAHIQKQEPIPIWLWFVVAGLFVAILVLRRVLKWR